MLEAMDGTLDVIATPPGTYAFLTSYVFLAGEATAMIICRRYGQVRGSKGLSWLHVSRNCLNILSPVVIKRGSVF